MHFSTFFARTAVALLLVSFCAEPAFAQRLKWWKDDQFRRELRLTGEQSALLEEIFQSNLPALRERMQQLEEAQQQLDRIIERGDDPSILAQLSVVESARAELNKARTMMLLRMRRALTADQWAKFTTLSQERRRKHRYDSADRR